MKIIINFVKSLLNQSSPVMQTQISLSLQKKGRNVLGHLLTLLQTEAALVDTIKISSGHFSAVKVIIQIQCRLPVDIFQPSSCSSKYTVDYQWTFVNHQSPKSKYNINRLAVEIYMPSKLIKQIQCRVQGNLSRP